TRFPPRYEEGMKKVNMLCLLGALFAPLPLLGQAGSGGTVIGQVTDASTLRPLSGATVTIQGTTIGRITGQDGRFILLNVPAGQHTVSVRMIGYATDTEGVTVTAG